MLLPPFKPVVQILMVPVKKQLDYLIYCTKYVRNMNIKMRELDATRIDVEEQMNRNTNSHFETTRQLHFSRWVHEDSVSSIECYDDSLKDPCVLVHVFFNPESCSTQLPHFDVHIHHIFYEENEVA